MKKCPFCAEEVQDDAMKCRFCSEFFIVPDQSHSPNELKWFYYNHGVYGPFTVEELREAYSKGTINDDTSVWHTDNKEPMVALKKSIISEYTQGKEASKEVPRPEAMRQTLTDSKLVCPHCQSRGSVTTKTVKRKKGVSGAKATGAILTLGWSLLATGLSRTEQETEAHCMSCGATWHFS